VALKPTIYKIRISLSDLNRQVYDTLNLTIALHPSETMERMMARVIAFCINVDEHLTFTKGLSEADEPDIWAQSLNGELQLWIDLGEPLPERIKKATHRARAVKVYSFNSKSDVWWSQGQAEFGKLRADVYRFNTEQIKQLASMVERTMDISVTISEQSAFVATQAGECEVSWVTLQEG